MKVLVTGGAGFIGSNLAHKLVSDGYEVRIADNLSTGRLSNLNGIIDQVEFMRVDLSNPDAARRAVSGTEIVFHQAALPSVPRSVRDPIATTIACVMATVAVLTASKEAGVRRVVYAASSSAYGDAEGLPRAETILPSPISPYAAAKLAGEHFCKAFAKVYGLETVALRYFNVFGPRQDPTSQYAAVIPKFISALLSDQELHIYGDGEQTRDFTYVDNVVEANILAAEAPGAVGETLNVATGEQWSINQLVDILEEITGRKARRVYLSERPGDARHSLADISKARRLLGYKPRIGFKEGLERTVEWMRTSNDM
ncbi:MAG: SDR family oxidoreductase, partial [Armatimonadota bacterium]